MGLEPVREVRGEQKVLISNQAQAIVFHTPGLEGMQ